TPELRQVKAPFAFYGVEVNFKLRRILSFDLQQLVGERIRLLTRLAFFLQVFTYTLATLIAALFARADVYYSRDLPTVLVLSLIKPRRCIAYEPHRRSQSSLGQRLQNLAVRRAGTVIPITPQLAEDLIAGGADAAHVLVAHDGIRRARFEHVPDQRRAREHIGWPQDAFIVGYVGRLHTMSMDKGLGILIDALAQLQPGTVALALVGGPDTMAAVLQRQWQKAGLPASHFLYAGQVSAPEVPLYLSAFDVCAMPHPYTTQFARYTSPLKLFEYMASQRPIVASAMPGWADVVTDGESALLVPPGDADALAAAIQHLQADATLREVLAACAYAQVMAHYTWEARAQAILAKISDASERST
ncbi:MAG: glycosyltransferase, partial [Anaerolineae bacterium]|nr:glycosyltransferase [Anaerolineae bacterium]